MTPAAQSEEFNRDVFELAERLALEIGDRDECSMVAVYACCSLLVQRLSRFPDRKRRELYQIVIGLIARDAFDICI